MGHQEQVSSPHQTLHSPAVPLQSHYFALLSTPRRLNNIIQNISNPNPVALPICEMQSTEGRATERRIRHMVDARPPDNSHMIGGRKGGVPDVFMSARPLKIYLVLYIIQGLLKRKLGFTSHKRLTLQHI